MNTNKGITLVVLVITIIVLLILSTSAVYVGYDTIQKSAQQRYISQLKEVQEAVRMHKDDYTYLNLTPMESAQQIDGISYEYELKTEADFNEIGLANSIDAMYVNFETLQIYGVKGIDGKHTLKDFGIEDYVPTKEELPNESNLDLNITLEPKEYSWIYIIKNEDINYNGDSNKL